MTMKSLTEREQLFVALGAAIGSNCIPCVEKILPKAKAAGIENWELRLALGTADFVRQKPARAVLASAEALVEGGAPAEPGAESCPLDEAVELPGAKAGANPRTMWGCCG
jgi:4-carboxymuconolactone decarboxylase